MKIQALSFNPAIELDYRCSPQEAAFAMRRNNADCVVISRTDAEQATAIPAGIVTEKDLAIFMLGDTGDGSNTCIGELCNDNLVTVSELDTTAEAIWLMNYHGIHRLPVMRKDGSLAGILTVDDLLSFLAAENAHKTGWGMQKTG